MDDPPTTRQAGGRHTLVHTDDRCHARDPASMRKLLYRFRRGISSAMGSLRVIFCRLRIVLTVGSLARHCTAEAVGSSATQGRTIWARGTRLLLLPCSH